MYANLDSPGRHAQLKVYPGKQIPSSFKLNYFMERSYFHYDEFQTVRQEFVELADVKTQNTALNAIVH